MSGSMFDETLRALRQLEGQTQLSIPIEYDEDGYLDRECPADECLFQFKFWLTIGKIRSATKKCSALAAGTRLNPVAG